MYKFQIIIFNYSRYLNCYIGAEVTVLTSKNLSQNEHFFIAIVTAGITCTSAFIIIFLDEPVQIGVFLFSWDIDLSLFIYLLFCQL